MKKAMIAAALMSVMSFSAHADDVTDMCKEVAGLAANSVKAHDQGVSRWNVHAMADDALSEQSDDALTKPVLSMGHNVIDYVYDNIGKESRADIVGNVYHACIFHFTR